MEILCRWIFGRGACRIKDKQKNQQQQKRITEQGNDNHVHKSTIISNHSKYNLGSNISTRANSILNQRFSMPNQIPQSNTTLTLTLRSNSATKFSADSRELADIALPFSSASVCTRHKCLDLDVVAFLLLNRCWTGTGRNMACNIYTHEMVSNMKTLRDMHKFCRCVFVAMANDLGVTKDAFDKFASNNNEMQQARKTKQCTFEKSGTIYTIKGQV